MAAKADDASRLLAKLLDPTVLRHNLVLASLFLAAYELLKHAVVGRILDFYTIGGTHDTPETRAKYDREVLQLDRKNRLRASARWLQKAGVVTPEDVVLVDSIRTHRNDVAHELSKYVMDPDHEVSTHQMEEMRRLLRKIEVWWIKEVETPSDPQYDGVDVPKEEIVPGTVAFFDTILQVAMDVRGEGFRSQ